MNNKRITKQINQDYIVLYPEHDLSIKVHKNDTDTTLNMNPTIWDILQKLCYYEDMEEKLRMPIDQFITAIEDPVYLETLPDKIIEQAFKHQELKYLIIDAKRQFEDYQDYMPQANSLTEDDFVLLANIFKYDHDCNIADNDQWQTIIEDYISKLNTNQKKKGRLNQPRND